MLRAVGASLLPQDITIRRLEDEIAAFEEGAEAKVEEQASARAKELQEVSSRGGAMMVGFFFRVKKGCFDVA